MRPRRVPGTDEGGGLGCRRGPRPRGAVPREAARPRLVSFVSGRVARRSSSSRPLRLPAGPRRNASDRLTVQASADDARRGRSGHQRPRDRHRRGMHHDRRESARVYGTKPPATRQAICTRSSRPGGRAPRRRPDRCRSSFLARGQRPLSRAIFDASSSVRLDRSPTCPRAARQGLPDADVLQENVVFHGVRGGRFDAMSCRKVPAVPSSASSAGFPRRKCFTPTTRTCCANAG